MTGHVSLVRTSSCLHCTVMQVRLSGGQGEEKCGFIFVYVIKAPGTKVKWLDDELDNLNLQKTEK